MEQSLNVFSNQIGFDVDFITNPKVAQISVFQGKWDDRDGKTPVFTIVDGETDTVDGDGAFLNELEIEMRRHPKRIEDKLALFTDFVGDADAIDVTRDQMAP
jgi:hypothetical protein